MFENIKDFDYYIKAPDTYQNQTKSSMQGTHLNEMR